MHIMKQLAALLLILAAGAAIADPVATRKISVDAARPDRPFSLTIGRGSEEVIEVTLYVNGGAYAGSDASGVLYYSASVTNTAGHSIASSTNVSGKVYFPVSATNSLGFSTNAADYPMTNFCQIVITAGGVTHDFQQGSWISRWSPATSGAGTASIGETLRWDLISSYVGTAGVRGDGVTATNYITESGETIISVPPGAGGGDITEVAAGSGLEGGGTIGAVTLTATGLLARVTALEAVGGTNFTLITLGDGEYAGPRALHTEHFEWNVGADRFEVASNIVAGAEAGATAYGWGDHAGEGYLTAEVDHIWAAVSNSLIARIGSLETMTNAVAISATVNGTNYPAVGGAITFTTPASTGETYDDAWTNGITRAAYGDYAGITNPPSIPAAADYSFTNSLVYSLTVNGTNYTPTAGVVTLTTPIGVSGSGTLTNVTAGTWLEGGGAGPDVPISVDTNAVMEAVAAKGYLPAEAQTLQDVVTLGGAVTSGAVTIDAANARTNTFGGVLTILGRAVTSGEGHTVGDRGFAAGEGHTVGAWGFGAGYNNTVGIQGFGAGIGNIVGVNGFGAGTQNRVGENGFGAGNRGKGADGSFVFSDSQTNDFDRTAHTNAFSVRALGGAYFDVPGLTVTGNVAAASFTLDGDTITAWPTGTGGGDFNTTGTLAATNTGTAGQVYYLSEAGATNVGYFADAPSGGGISEATATNIAAAVAFGAVIPYALASSTNVTIDRLTGTNRYSLTLTHHPATLTIATNSWLAAEDAFLTLTVNRGTNTLGYSTLTITNATLIDVPASTLVPLTFRKLPGELWWRVRQ